MSPVETTRRTAWALLATVVSAGLVAACAEPVGDRVRIEIAAADFDEISNLDTLEVTIAASRTPEGDAVCEPHTETFALSPSSPVARRLPLVIEITPGARYNQLLYVRVVGRLSGTVRLKTERMASLQGGGVEQLIRLTRSCLGVGTGRGKYCDGGVSYDSPYWRIFDQGEFVDAGEPCL